MKRRRTPKSQFRHTGEGRYSAASPGLLDASLRWHDGRLVVDSQ
jgi:hypothetical protein